MLEAEVTITVPFHDLDPMGVVWHGNYARYLEIARCALLDLIGYNYLQMRESGYAWPVVDMRLKFGMSQTEKTVNTCVIVMEIALGGETTIVGSLADSVQEVIELEDGQIEPPPRIGTRLKTEFIKGMGKREEEFIILLEIDRVFSSEELAMVQESGREAAGPVA